MLETPSGPVSRLPPPRPEVVQAIRDGKTLPMLDLGQFIAGTPGAMEQLAADVRCIQESLGFYYIVNYGFDPKLIDEALEQNLELFALPEEAKAPYTFRHHMQGYWPLRRIVNVRPGYEEDHEIDKSSELAGWVFLRDRDENDPKVKNNVRHRAMNKWPDPQLLPDFRRVVSRYHQAMVQLGLKMVKVYAVALGLREDYFDRDFTDLEWYSRSNYAKGYDNPAGMAATAHSDHSFLTLLPISPIPALQVRTPARTWLPIDYVPGGIVVNTGEWLNGLSNGRFLATPHRVVQPKPKRVSMPVFINPNDEAMDIPVPGALASGEQPKRTPRKWHDFFLSYIDGYTNATGGGEVAVVCRSPSV
jgi:isopenicillin N synthase-like dioxygenase